MSDKPIIKVENISKKYCQSLRQVMSYGAMDIARDFFNIKTNSEELRNGEFWAVKDVSFEVKRGETLGLIGVNGAGKTTILKMLNGIFMPDKGKITISGQVGGLIEIGAGFHPLLTGRENIYINGAILGMPREEIARKFEKIVNFADIGSFLDLPLKHYSSGMHVRLGFAIAIHSEADILLIDEVLAVGDLSFIVKCTRKMAEFIENGGTLVLVSHSMQTIRNNVKRAIFIDQGVIQKDGSVNSVCDRYESFILNQKRDKYIGRRILNDDTAIIKGVNFIPEIGQIKVGADIIIRIHYQSKKKIVNPIFTVSIFNMEYILMASSYSYLDGFTPAYIEGEGVVNVKMASVNFVPGEYIISVTLAQQGVSNVFDWHDKRYFFKVNGDFHCYGLIDLAAAWHEETR